MLYNFAHVMGGRAGRGNLYCILLPFWLKAFGCSICTASPARPGSRSSAQRRLALAPAADGRRLSFLDSPSHFRCDVVNGRGSAPSETILTPAQAGKARSILSGHFVVS